MTVLLAPEQLEDYDRDGFVLLGAVLTPDEAAELVADVERLKPPVAFGGERNQTLLVNIHLCDRSVPTRRLCIDGPQVAAMTQLIGPDVALTHNQILWKLPDGEDTHSDIPFHQDNGYGELDPFTDVTVWIALTDTDERNGCLWIVPGSHRHGLLAHAMADINPFLREGADGAGAVPLPMRAGEAVAFSGLTVHGSGPNHTEDERIGFYIRYCDPATTMTSERGKRVLDDPNSWMVAGVAPA